MLLQGGTTPLSKTLELLTSLETFDALHIIADGRREFVKVNRQDLQNLLIDHTCLLQAVGSSYQVTSPPPKLRRVKIVD